MTYHHGNLRAALLERAVVLIEAEGVAAVSLRSLARELGVSHAAPARHFRTRAELLGAIALDGGERLVGSTEEALADVGDAPLERLRAIADAFLVWVVAHPAYNRVMRHPDVLRHADTRLIELLRGFAATLERTIEAARAEGWKRDVPTSEILFQFIATVDGAAAVLTEPLYRNVRSALFDGEEPTRHALDELFRDA